jgi:hypothetical protein
MLDACLVFHACFWIYLILAPLCSRWHARFVLLWVIPFVYILHMLPFHLLHTYETESLGIEHLDVKEREEILADMTCDILPFLEPVFKIQFFCRDHCVFSPLSAQGMLILAAIISSNVLLRT